MNRVIIGLLAETNLHPGTGQSTGVVDLPVAREKATGYPVIVGSSLKGSLRDLAEKPGNAVLDVEGVFGSPNNAGVLGFTDARLLLLPVRSLTAHYKWVTCPYLLERYARDRELAGLPTALEIPIPQPGQAVIANGEGMLFLEELSYQLIDADLTGVIEAIKPLIRHSSVRDRLAQGLVLLSDDEFKHFASQGLQVNARNVLEKETKTSKNLWYEETVPADSLFYTLAFARPGREEALAQLLGLFTQRPYLQVGGNETVGQGWCALTWFGERGEGQ